MPCLQRHMSTDKRLFDQNYRRGGVKKWLAFFCFMCSNNNVISFIIFFIDDWSWLWWYPGYKCVLWPRRVRGTCEKSRRPAAETPLYNNLHLEALVVWLLPDPAAAWGYLGVFPENRKLFSLNRKSLSPTRVGLSWNLCFQTGELVSLFMRLLGQIQGSVLLARWGGKYICYEKVKNILFFCLFPDIKKTC